MNSLQQDAHGSHLCCSKSLFRKIKIKKAKSAQNSPKPGNPAKLCFLLDLKGLEILAGKVLDQFISVNTKK